MSATIDERVVEMRFDNRQFESNARESLGTLEKLKQALNLDSSTKNFDNLQKAANGVNMSGLSSAIESVKLKFSALEIMAITALTNITNKAVNAGTQLVKSLTIDQVTAGWEKYAQKTQSVQTIMAATAKDFSDTGEQMEYVNAQLDKLNWFTDETSYNFLEMVNNIGKFTNNNIKLDDAVTSMQGISTWAALAGANSEEAGRAMYNLSQAISVGAVKLQDWKSIENANMATAEFKETAMQTAVEMGILSESFEILQPAAKYAGDAMVTVANFSQTLSSGWFSADVLTATLAKYGAFTDELYEASLAMEGQYSTVSELLGALDEYKAGTLDMTEIMQNTGLTAEEVAGYFDILADSTMALGEKGFRAAQEAKTFREAIDATKDAVSTGWLNTFELIFGNYEEAKVLWTDFANFLYDIFAESGNMRNEILAGWKEAGGRDDLFDGIKAGWNSLLSILGPVKEAWDYIFPPKSVDERAAGLVELTKSFKSLMESLKLSDSASDKLKRTFQGLFAIVDLGKQGFSALLKLLPGGVSILGNLGEGVLSVTAKIGDWLVSLDNAAKSSQIFGVSVDKLLSLFKSGASKVKDFASAFKALFKEAFTAPDLNPLKEFLTIIHERFHPIQSIVDLASVSFKTFFDILKSGGTVLGGFASAVAKGLAGFGTKLAESFTGGNFNSIMDLVNGGIMAGLGLKITDFIGSLSNISEKLTNVPNVLEGIKTAVVDTFGTIQSNLKASTLTQIATAIAVLSASLIALSLIDSDKLTGSLTAIAALFLDLFASMAMFEKIMNGSQMKSLSKVSSVMVVISASILVLAGAMKKIADIDSDKLTSSVMAITVLITELTGVALILEKYGKKLEQGTGYLLTFSSSIYILTSAMKKIADIDADRLLSSVMALSVVIGELAGVAILLGQYGGKIETGSLSLLAFASSVVILSSAVEKLSALNVNQLIKGLGAVTVLIVEMAAVMASASKFKDFGPKQAVSLNALASSLLIFEKAVEGFAGIPLTSLAKGLAAVAVSMGEMLAAMYIFSANDMSTKASSSMLVMASSMLVLMPVLKNLAAMDWNQIAKAMVGMGGALAEMTLAMYAINAANISAGTAVSIGIMATSLLALIPTFKALGGMSWGEIAKGLVALAGAFTVLGVAGAVIGPLAPAIVALSGSITLLGIGVAAAGAGILAFAAGLTALSVAGVSAVTSVIAMMEVLIVGMVNVIKDSIVSIGGVVKAIVLMVCDVIVACVPDVVKTVLVVVKEVLEALAANAPDIVKYLLKMLIGIVDELAKAMPDVVKAVVNLFMSFFSSIIDALDQMDSSILVNGIAGIALVSALLIALAALAGLAPAAMIGVLAMGAVIAELAIVLAAIGALAQIPGLKWLMGEGGSLLQGVGVAIGNFVGGIVGGFMSGMSSQFPKIGKDLSDFIINVKPFIEGAKSIDASAMNGVNSLAQTILILTAANVLDGLTSWFTGGSSIVKFGQQLSEFGPYFSKYYQSVKGVDSGVVQASANAALALAEMANKLPNQGGVISWFAGENLLSDFAKELEKFGPSLKSYANSVKGLDANVVTASANAALALAEMANKLPNQGGVAGWFMGDNTLSTFAKELEKFGPPLKTYANSVRGLDANVVTASANAALSIANMASNLPNQGGVVSWFTGDNTLSKFGTELSKFGPYIAEYSRSVAGINGSVVTASVSAAKTLSEFANNLPNQGGIVSWFTGDNTLSKFGKELSKFGSSIADYSKTVSGINTGQMGSVIVQVRNLMNLLTDMGAVDSSKMKAFSDGLKKLGTAGIDEFVKAFKESDSKVKAAVDAMIDYAITTIDSNTPKISKSATSSGEESAKALEKGLKNKKNDIVAAVKEIAQAIINTFKDNLKAATFKSIGSDTIQSVVDGMSSKTDTTKAAVSSLCSATITQMGASLPSSTFSNYGSSSMQSFASGITSKSATVSSSAVSLCNNVVTQMRNALPANSFTSIGQNAGNGLSSGISGSTGKASSAAKSLASAAISGLKNNLTYNSFYNVGSNAGSGLSAGITSKINSIKNAAINAAKSAVNAAKSALQIKSPSRVFRGIGENVSLGMSGGILGKLSTIVKAGFAMADVVVDPVKDAIQRISDTINEDDTIYEPVITPVIDTSSVKDGTDEIASMFHGLDLSTTSSLAEIASSGFNRSSVGTRKPEDNVTPDVNKPIKTDEIQNQSVSYYNTFNIQSNDPRRAADEVDRILQRRVERGKATWGK